MRKTKIVCTLGPATGTPEIIRNMILAGMDAARFNFSHGTHESHLKLFETLVSVRNELKVPVPAILDTKGPEIRLKKFTNGKAFLPEGGNYTLTTRDVPGNESIGAVTYKDLPMDVKAGTRILLDDGLIELKVLSVKGTEIACTIISSGEISDNKGINLPDTRISMPYVSKADIDDIQFGIRTGFDFIAASFVRSKEDVMAIRKILNENDGRHIRIMAKIENAEGVANMEEIIEASDAIMVARGDMGVEIALEEIPVIQKRMIKAAYTAGKQVVTATQMLESMVFHPRPTRAETTDVANAIYDSTSAVMLSGETANGKYPLEAIRIMVKIAERAEQDIHYRKRFFERSVNDVAHDIDITDAISHATCLIAYNLNVKAIITVSKSGATARMISRFRPGIPIIGCTPDASTLRQMNLSWGVVPLLIGEEHVTEELFREAINASVQAGIIEKGDLVVLTAGVPLGVSGTTNLIKVQHVV